MSRRRYTFLFVALWIAITVSIWNFTSVHASSILALPPTVVQTNQSNAYTTGTQNFASAVHTIPTIVVALVGSLPSTGCTPGELAFVTSAALGEQVYENSGTGACVWTQQGGGPGGSVLSFSGDGALLTNSASTGAVTAALGNASANNFWAGPTSGGATTPGYRLIVAGDLPSNQKIRTIGAGFDGGGSALTSGSTATTYFTVPFACTIAAWNITVDTGTITLDVWKIATGTAIPTVANTITASALPAISSGTAVHSTTLTGWTTAVSANDIFGININTVATATKASLTLQCNAT